MSSLLPLTIVGLVSGCIYAVTAAGLVVTYTTTGIFNFAHGAIGMIAAFSFWSLSVHYHWPVVLSLVVIIGIEAPLMGALIERVLMRPLRGAGLDVTLTITLGLLLFLIGLATIVWNPETARVVPPFFGADSVKLFGVVVTAHQIVVVCVAVLVAIGLRLLLFRTKLGTTLRGVVDNRELVALAGASPVRYGQLGWMIGSMLAAVAGILLAAIVTLDITTLTLLVITGYAAAMVGRLRSLPLAFAGAIALGLAQSYLAGYVHVGSFLTEVQPVVPMIFLFVVLIILPERRIQLRSPNLRMPRVAGLRESLLASAVFVLIVWIVSAHLSQANLETAGHGIAVALVMLSLVLLTGYGGQVSLCQLTFAGLGAFAMGKIAGGGSWLGLLAAIGLSAGVGALVALPALRLRGLYLALATLAFAQAMDFGFFNNGSVFGTGNALDVGRPSLFGLSLKSNRTFLVFISCVFALAAIGVLSFRRSRLGRRVVALSSSPPASVTLGMKPTSTRLILFMLSAGLAGLAGALYGSQQLIVGPNDFQLLASLTLLLLAVVWGIRTTTGMLIGGLLFAIFPVIQSHVTSLRDLAYLGTGLAAIGIGRNPNGAFGGATPAQKRRDRRAALAASGANRPTGSEPSAPHPSGAVHA